MVYFYQSNADSQIKIGGGGLGIGTILEGVPIKNDTGY